MALPFRCPAAWSQVDCPVALNGFAGDRLAHGHDDPDGVYNRSSPSSH